MLHAAFDFQTHLLPVLMMASLAIGLVMPAASPSRSLLARGMHAALLIMTALLAVVAVIKESVHAGGWMKWEGQRQANYAVDPGELPQLRGLVENSPHYFAFEMYGRLQLSAYTQAPEADRPEIVFRLQEARWGLEQALKRHREDPRSLVELGLVLDLLGEFDEAARVHVEAIRVTRIRERKFGAYAGLSLHLALRGKHLWYSRRPEEAFGCFLLAREYLELSRRRGYPLRNLGEQRTILKFYIKSLQDGKIRPEFPPDILNRFPHPDVSTTRWLAPDTR
jgi:tetratricopeptide (TPR) repeat protein